MNIKAMKQAVKRWRLSADPRFVARASKLAKYIKGYEKGGCTLPTLISYYYQLEKL